MKRNKKRSESYRYDRICTCLGIETGRADLPSLNESRYLISLLVFRYRSSFGDDRHSKNRWHQSVKKNNIIAIITGKKNKGTTIFFIYGTQIRPIRKSVDRNSKEDVTLPRAE